MALTAYSVPFYEWSNNLKKTEIFFYIKYTILYVSHTAQPFRTGIMNEISQVYDYS